MANILSAQPHLLRIVATGVDRPPNILKELLKEWLIAARQAHLMHVPADPAGDAMLAASMCSKEHWLLGYDPRISEARPNGPAMELLTAQSDPLRKISTSSPKKRPLGALLGVADARRRDQRP